MAGILDAGVIPIPCGHCGRKHRKSIGWLRTHTKIRCVCGTLINVKADQLKSEMKKVDRAFDQLKQTLKNFGR